MDGARRGPGACGLGPTRCWPITCSHPRRRVWCACTGASRPTRPEVWLTIDDGPDPEDTPRILELLAAHGARATFFVIGENAAAHPGLIRAIAAAGHEVAHHTHTHPLADVLVCFTGPGGTGTRRGAGGVAPGRSETDAISSARRDQESLAGAGPPRPRTHLRGLECARTGTPARRCGGGGGQGNPRPRSRGDSAAPRRPPGAGGHPRCRHPPRARTIAANWATTASCPDRISWLARPPLLNLGRSRKDAAAIAGARRRRSHRARLRRGRRARHAGGWRPWNTECPGTTAS